MLELLAGDGSANASAGGSAGESARDLGDHACTVQVQAHNSTLATTITTPETTSLPQSLESTFTTATFVKCLNESKLLAQLLRHSTGLLPTNACLEEYRLSILFRLAIFQE